MRNVWQKLRDYVRVVRRLRGVSAHAADREVVEIKAAAQRDAEILRGEGEGERNAIFADAFWP